MRAIRIRSACAASIDAADETAAAVFHERALSYFFNRPLILRRVARVAVVANVIQLFTHPAIAKERSAIAVANACSSPRHDRSGKAIGNRRGRSRLYRNA
jgi:hypothetical protein